MKIQITNKVTELCKKEKIKSYSKWNKNELINKLETYYNSNISMNDA